MTKDTFESLQDDLSGVLFEGHSNNGKSINLPSGESRQVGGASQHLKRPCGPSLRRDKQLEEEIKSDLQVHHPMT